MSDKLQVENGSFTRIVNEVLDELVKIPLLGKEFAILLFIIRKTYGFQKTSDIISLTQIEKGTKTGRPTVVKTLKNLVARNMIVKTPLLGGNISFSFNKYHEKWVVKTPKLVKEKWVASKDPLTETSKDPLTHKRKKEITKERLAETSSAITSSIISIIDLFKEINPAYKDWFKNTTQRLACEWLITNFGLEKTQKMVAYLSKLNSMKYAPVSTTPYELKNNFAKIKVFLAKEKFINSKYKAEMI